MAKLTTEERARLMGSVNVMARAKINGIPVDESDKNNQNIARTIDSARVQGSYDSHRDTETAIVLPEHIPQTREESGLVDPNMTLDESQLNGLRVIHDAQYACLIGAAGTGKTTLVKRGLANHIYGGDGFERKGIRSYNDGKLSIAVVAFTGKAVQVVKNTLPAWLRPCCNTIHGLLEYMPAEHAKGDEIELEDGKRRGRFIPTRDAHRPLDQNLLIVDEASMVGVDLWHNLIDACKPGTRIILIGDLNQLTPVADAPFFPMALQAANEEQYGWRLAELTTIHRQKGVGANRIIDTAHAVLNGRRPEFDFELNAAGKQVDSRGKPVEEPKTVKDWRVVNIQVDGNTDKAHQQIATWLKGFAGMNIPDSEFKVYKPHEDLVLTAGNGDSLDQPGALVQQAPINATLSDIFAPDTEETPTYIIDAGRETRKYTVGDRVMCRKNESPAVKDRVTNGMLGKIVKIEPNLSWEGDKKRFGTQKEVHAARSAALKSSTSAFDFDSTLGTALDNMASSNDTMDHNEEQTERQASHHVTIEYETGAIRTYSSAAGVAATQLGYALTTHKAQGSQADTVFIVCHSAAKRQLNREWLYTGVTRAQSRVIMFSTAMGINTAIARQQVYGASLAEKINRYCASVKQSGKYIQLTTANEGLN